MRRFRRRRGGGGLMVLALAPFVIYLTDFGIRMTNGDVLTGGLNTATLASFEIIVSCIIGIAAANIFWFWNRFAGAGFGLVCALVSYYLIQLLEGVYICQIGLGCG